jgi:hypothetical protein
MRNHGPFLLIVSLLLNGCIPATQAPQRPQKRPTAALPSNDTLLQCTNDLTRLGAQFIVLPDQSAGNCSAINTVQISGVGVPVTNLTATQCPLARAFTLWTKDVEMAARFTYRASISRIETMGSYSCRKVNGVASNRLSEHAFANAIDVSGFTLTDGRRITLEGGWNGSEDERKFLRQVRSAGCKRFQTVLSPDFNAAHYNHLHFDMGNGPYCR